LVSIWSLFFLSLCLLLSFSFLQAQPATEPSEPLKSLYTNSSGLQIKDAVIEMAVSEANESGQLSPSSSDLLTFKKPNSLRVDSTLIDPGGTYDEKKITIIRDGTNSFMYMDGGAFPVKKSLDEPSGTNNLPYYLQVYPQDQENQVSASGNETVEGVNCRKININLSAFPGNTVKLWVDTQKRVPVKIERNYPQDGNNPARTLVISYQDIRQLPDGRYFPFKLVFSQNGQTTKTIIYKTVKINTGVEDGIFHPSDKKNKE